MGYWNIFKRTCRKLLRISRTRSIQSKFLEISVQNSMDRFGPTGKVSKNWSTFEVDHFSRSDRSEFWLNAESRPTFPGRTAGSEFWLHGSRPETLTDNRIHILPKLEYTSQAYNPHTEYRLHNETCIILRASSRLP